jgi:hypothetical protein
MKRHLSVLAKLPDAHGRFVIVAPGAVFLFPGAEDGDTDVIYQMHEYSRDAEVKLPKPCMRE